MMNIESFKTMFRLIDFQKRVFLAKNWKTFSAWEEAICPSIRGLVTKGIV